MLGTSTNYTGLLNSKAKSNDGLDQSLIITSDVRKDAKLSTPHSNSNRLQAYEVGELTDAASGAGNLV